MGYRKKKLAIEKDIKKLKKIALWIVTAITLFLCVFSAFVPADTWVYYVGLPQISKREAGELRMHFIDVGQGDCSLIEFPDGKTMLIDGGDRSEKTSTTILRYLNSLKINKLDYLLLTHTDSDHCGGLDKVVKYKKIGTAYLPKADEEVNKQFTEFYAELLEQNCDYQYSKKSISITSKSVEYPYTLSFLYPYTVDVENADKMDTNELSAVCWLDYFGVSALFTGDAPFDVEENIVRDSQLSLNPEGVDLTSTEILKVAHHGSNYSTSAEFLEYLNVETAVISCAKENAYNHPGDALVERLQKEDIKDYRTYRDGHIVITATKEGKYSVRKISA